MSVYVPQALRGGIVDRSLPSSATATFPAPCRASTALAGSRPATGWPSKPPTDGAASGNLGQFVPRGEDFGMVRAVKLQPAMRLTIVKLYL
jgi:hypothetical protein